jgi:hypothetical protein
MIKRLVVLTVGVGMAVIAVTMVSLLATSTADAKPDHARGPVPEGCAKIDSEDVGIDDVSVTVGDDVAVTVDSWIAKDDEENEYAGLSWTPSVPYTVKAGNEVFDGEGSSWTNPAGTSGPAVHGISYVVFCPPSD